MDEFLTDPNATLVFIDALRARGASSIRMGSLAITFEAPTPPLEKIQSTEFIPTKELSADELDALLYAETIKL